MGNFAKNFNCVLPLPRLNVEYGHVYSFSKDGVSWGCFDHTGFGTPVAFLLDHMLAVVVVVLKCEVWTCVQLLQSWGRYFLWREYLLIYTSLLRSKNVGFTQCRTLVMVIVCNTPFKDALEKFYSLPPKLS